ncbi:arsenite S-adenosylmethyltransferase [Polystyrenella longa]|uniref:Arsenite methyltransferase n=1 Tax=Polystyrenella longa TaxID=2528007 RepID=A0A518CSY8_9PLAN|nr:methyltransferase domain-containing protein [Polystyrenella longa]QDU82294.1 arsenite S-adenosylmethyltransferase [Polystyrenella longa]
MSTSNFTTSESSVYDRYASAAKQVEPALCCPVEYSTDLLEVIPDEILERDYGCGDPTPFVEPGDTVLDLGSGGGKLCYIAAQLAGPEGQIIGVDCNREMLGLARKHQQTVAERIGFHNVDFRYGMIQDLQLNLQLLEQELSVSPVKDASDFLRLRNIEERLRKETPLVESDSVDCVLSNCVLNLVRQPDRKPLFSEIYRVLRRGGRAAISDIVSDETVPEEMKQDPKLWSGCISGAFREDEFLQQFEEAGFHGIEIVKRVSEPWQTINGIEFRSITVVAHKGKDGPCLERNQAVVYKGPFKSVEDDDGHRYRRGIRMAVCDKTYRLLNRKPYTGLFENIEPLVEIPLADALSYDCKRTKHRHPRETKGEDYEATIDAEGPCCGTDGDCC